MVGLDLKGRCNVAPFFLFLGLEFLPGVLPDITITQMAGVKKDEMNGLHSVVEDGVLEVEPENAIIWLCMDAVLSYLVVERLAIWQHHGQFKHLKEAVSILRSELDSEFQVLSSSIEIIIGVLRVVVHVQPGTFTPNLSALRNLVETLNECLVGQLENLSSLASRMLKLYQSSPKTTSCIVNLE
jgi:hypothetical protein